MFSHHPGPGFGRGHHGPHGRPDCGERGFGAGFHGGGAFGERFVRSWPDEDGDDARFAGPRGPFGGDGPGGFGHRGGPGGQRGGPGGRGRDGLARFFAHGDLRLVVLSLIAEKPRHGYEIIKEIEDRVGGAYSPSPGVIYPTLTMLEDVGHVSVSEEGGKKLHAITDLGRAFLDANRPTVDALMARMTEAGRGRGGDGRRRVVEAMERLGLALRHKLARPDLDEAKLVAAIAAVDAAVKAIEELE
jgi:DNA-binding PadR family transcriptional regulator